MGDINSAELRKALSSYATGIVVVSTTCDKGQPVGMTINSFASVSLAPALVLWSIAKDSIFFDVFNQVPNFAIHVLRQDQQDLSNHFAMPNEDNFATIPYDSGLADLPLLKSYISCFQCRVECRHEGGDHIIIVGQVLDFNCKPADPLIFHDSQYKSLS
ncbi:MAG: flavin reductase family protein [Alphaproteobacteria bacterium]|nr:flavin reductase family protein [Alphaproteobacteria bacterium]